MIHANELRLGLKVILPDWNRDGSDKIWDVRDIYTDNNYVGLTDGRIQTTVKLDRLKPILLTEEILVKSPEITKCKFNPERYNLRNPKSQFHIIFNGERFVFRGLGMSVVYVDTLHHLQNLVFVNTNKELEINL